MTATFGDLNDIEVEHLLGAATGRGLVKIRAISADRVLLGEIDPDAARQIASHLMECAARAEYEQDFADAAKASGIDDEATYMMLSLVRRGEQNRHEGD